MSNHALTKKYVKLAFKAIGDLAIDVELVKVSSTFDFNTGVPDDEESLPIYAKALSVSKAKYSDSRNTYVRELTLGFVADIHSYDKVIINDDEWVIGAPIVDDGYLLVLEIYKENV